MEGGVREWPFVRRTETRERLEAESMEEECMDAGRGKWEGKWWWIVQRAVFDWGVV